MTPQAETRVNTGQSHQTERSVDYHITESAHRLNLDVVSTVAEGYDPDLEAAR